MKPPLSFFSKSTVNQCLGTAQIIIIMILIIMY